MTKQLETLNKVLNLLNYSGRTEGALAECFIQLRDSAMKGIEIIKLAELENFYFAERNKQDLIVILDYPTGEYRVGNFFMFKAFIEHNDPRNLAGVFKTQAEAQSRIDLLAQDAKEFERVLDGEERLHP